MSSLANYFCQPRRRYRTRTCLALSYCDARQPADSANETTLSTVLQNIYLTCRGRYLATEHTAWHAQLHTEYRAVRAFQQNAS